MLRPTLNLDTLALTPVTTSYLLLDPTVKVPKVPKVPCMPRETLVAPRLGALTRRSERHDSAFIAPSLDPYWELVTQPEEGLGREAFTPVPFVSSWDYPYNPALTAFLDETADVFSRLPD